MAKLCEAEGQLARAREENAGLQEQELVRTHLAVCQELERSRRQAVKDQEGHEERIQKLKEEVKKLNTPPS